MPYVIAVIAAGAMGANVGRKLVEAGNIVLTSLEGRSDATRERAKKAGMVDASWSDIVHKSDIVISIIPPRDAISFAERLLEEYDSANRLPENPLVFADCNAVNVVTIKNIATLFTSSPITFLDGCIIGGPPSGNYVPTFYGSTDPGSERGLKLFEDIVRGSGIKVRVLNGDGSRIGSASALKMSYAVSFTIPRGSTHCKAGMAYRLCIGYFQGLNGAVHDDHFRCTFHIKRSISGLP